MAMKYVKLFEHWLLTEGEDDIDVFVSSKPKKFPVLDTTIGDYKEAYDEEKGFSVMKSFLQRAKQEIGSKEFNTNAGENLSVDFKNLLPKFDYFIMLKDQKIKENMQNIFGKALDINDLNGIAEKFGWDERAYGEVYIVKEGDCALFFEFDPEDISDEKLPITELPIKMVVLIKGGKEIEFPTKGPIVLGQILSFVNQGISLDNVAILNSKMKEKGLNIAKQIFAGEGKSSLGAFASTVKIGDMNLKLASGKKGDIIPLYVATNILGTCGFDFNSATLKDESKETLSLPELWKFLEKGKTIEIVGHTDSAGTEEVNLKLSKQRAESVLKFLQESPNADKIKGKKITTSGVGFKEMITDDKKGTDKNAAAANRRIVIKIDGVGPNYSKLGVK